MKTRFISGLVFAFIGMTMLLLENDIVDTVIIIVLCIMAMFEFYRAFRKIGVRPVDWVGYVSCLCIVLMSKVVSVEYKLLILKMVLPIVFIGLFVYLILPKVKRNISDIAITAISIIYIPCLFSFMKAILNMNHGRLLIWYVLFGAFASDTFAYLIGSKFGKNKLCPNISPKKTIEGSVGGICGVIIAYIILTLGINYYTEISMNVIYWVLVGIVASIAGQMGDLTASAIKRHCGIKDFGKIMPGHGGILDRFDSLIFVAPIVYIFIEMYI